MAAEPTPEQYAALQERYESLKRLRETEPEEQSSRIQATLDELQRSTDATIAQLRAENERLQQNQTEDFASAVTMAESLHAENAQLRQAATPAGKSSEAGAWQLQQVVTFYELLTGVSVTLAGDRAQCSCGDAQRPMAFEIDLAPEDGEEGDVGFNPTNLGGCADQLPDYMQESITCAPPPAAPAPSHDCAALHALPPARRPGALLLVPQRNPVPTCACSVPGAHSRASASSGAAAKAAEGALPRVRGRVVPVRRLELEHPTGATVGAPHGTAAERGARKSERERASGHRSRARRASE